ncbi:MAG: glycosyltransferase [Steroidobacteraceae bacterium]
MTERTALLIAFQFPPMRGTSAIQRTLRFAQHLPKFGWRPIVLTATRGAYEDANPSTERDAGAIEVHRALALDAARHLSIFGRYPLALALPDRWRTWKYAAVPAALRLIREQHVQVVWTTFPIATAHEIGLAVAQRSRLPWVAEFRDPMWQGDYPPDPRINREWQRLEERIFGHASRIVVTTPGAARDYRARFPEFGDDRVRIVENGFDEDAFAGAQSRIDSRPTTPADPGRRLTLLHSGVIYPSERDPTCLFDALASLKAGNDAVARRLSLRLRATGRDDLYRTMITKRGIDDMVSLEPAIDYVSALEEMLMVDGLLILQAANCNSQVPAKLYEYFRAGRPIVALTDPAGDTAATVHAAAAGLVSPLDSVAAIAATLREFVRRSDAQEWRVMSRAAAGCYSREHRTAELAELFAEVST